MKKIMSNVKVAAVSLNTIGTGLLVSVPVFLQAGDQTSALIAGVFGIAALVLYEVL